MNKTRHWLCSQGADGKEKQLNKPEGQGSKCCGFTLQEQLISAPGGERLEKAFEVRT